MPVRLGVHRVGGDGLPADQRATLDGHWRECEACRERFEQHRDEALFDELRAAVRAIRPREPESPAAIGVQVEGYEILHVLHSGGQGVVYKAVQKAT
jgi:hypothetical protein